MKKQAATLLILMLAVLTGLVNAQTRTVMTAQVPFDFYANGKMMPAGDCTIIIDGDGQARLWIASGNEHMVALPNSTESVSPSEDTTLLFHTYQGRYFLAGINRRGESRGYELPASKLEVELRAQNVIEKDVTLVASLR